MWARNISLKQTSFSLFSILAITLASLAAMLASPQKAFAAACTEDGSTYGQVTQTVGIPQTGTYKIWSRIMADSGNAANNSYKLEIDGTTCLTFTATGTNWIWVSSTNQSLTAGNHSLRMIGVQPNVSLDRVIFTADTTCVPNDASNYGDNCANPPDTTAPTVNWSSPTNGANVAANSSFSVTATDDVGMDKVDFYEVTTVGGNPVYTLRGSDSTASGSTYSASLTLTAGSSHNIVARAYDDAGNTTDTSSLNVTVADTTAPAISNINETSITQTSATVTWTTDELSDSQVEYGTTTSYGSSTTLNTTDVTSHSVGLSSLSPNTLYHYRVKSRDPSNNLATSTDGTFTTLAPAADTTQPTISMTTPANGATISGTSVSLTANASDNVGVVGVQFLIDGANYGTEDTSSPYSITLNTTSLSNGSHTVSARARDAAGNTRTATNVSVTVNNVTFRAEDINQDGAVNIADFNLLAVKYGQTGASLGRADINGDGRVNISDFNLLAVKYGT